MGRLSLKATLELTDRISRPLKTVNQKTKELRDSFNKSSRSLRDLERLMSNASAFKSLQSELGKVNNKLKNAAQEEARLAAAIRSTQNVTKGQQQSLAKASQALAKLKAQQSAYIQQLSQLKARLNSAGFETKGFANSEAKLAERIKTATSAMEQQRQKLKQLEDQQRKMESTQQRYSDAQQRASNVQSAGFSAMLKGGLLVGGLKPSVNLATLYETQALKLQVTGAGPNVVKQAKHLADVNTIKGISKLEALEVFTEGQVIMRDPHEVELLLPNLLKSKYILETLYKQLGHEHAGAEADSQLRDMIKVIELRGGTKSVKAFQEQQDFMMKAILGSGGVLKTTDWLDAIKTGGTATKMMNNEAFYYILGHMIQESGGFRAGTGAMSAFSNLGLGRTTQQAAEFMASQGLLDKSQLHYGKTGHVTKVLPGAANSADLFNNSPFEWMLKELIPKLNPKGDLTETQIKMKIAQAFSSRTAGNSFVQMYTDRANIQRQLKAYRKSYNTDQAYDATSKSTIGQESDLRAKYETLKIELGTELLPVYIKAIELTLKLVRAISRFTETHPKLTKFILISIAVIGILLISFGALLVVITSILSPILAFRGGLLLLRLAFGSTLGFAWLFRGGLFLLRGAFWLTLASMRLVRGSLVLLRVAFTGALGSIGAMTGALGVLSQAAAVFAAAYLGWEAGSALYQYQKKEWDDPINKSLVETFAFFGSSNAQRMKAQGLGFSKPNSKPKPVSNSFTERNKTAHSVKPPSVIATTTSVAPIKSAHNQVNTTNHFTAPNVVIHGATDPHTVGIVVDQKLAKWQRDQDAAQRRNYSDKA